MSTISGLHHVTCLVSDVGRARDFYVGVMGLTPLVTAAASDKLTSVPLYLGHPDGSPGTIVCLLDRQHAAAGLHGTGQVSNLVFAIAVGSEASWETRVADHGMSIDGYGWSFGERILCLSDPDGLALGLAPTIGMDAGEYRPAVGAIVSIEFQCERLEPMASLLTGVLGFQQTEQEGPVTRFKLGSSLPLSVDVLTAPAHRVGRVGAGTIERVAWSADHAGTLEELRVLLSGEGFHPTAVSDHPHFQTFDFEGPEGLEFAVAASVPGFGPPEHSPEGTRLVLPPWLESQRDVIESALAKDGRRS